MKSSAVSVILPTFNRVQYLRPAVESVFAQTFTDWHLIIADDGSEGATAGYLAELAARPRVTLLRLAHSGNPAAVRNAALREARGEYVAFLDSDDLWLPPKLEVQVGIQRTAGTRRWSYSAEDLIDAAGRILPIRHQPSHTLPAGAIFEQLLTLEAPVSTTCVLAERGLIEEVGGFDEAQQYFEDYDLWLRMSLRSEVTSISEPLALVRNHNEHYSADRVLVYQARLRLLEKAAGMTGSSRHRALQRLERAKTMMALAKVHAGLGHRAEAVRMLWQIRQYAWHLRGWWSGAVATLSRVLAPSWARSAVRRWRSARRERRQVRNH